jgi:hypothetical protein
MYRTFRSLALAGVAAVASLVAGVAAAATPIAPIGPTVVVLTATPTLVGAGVSVAPLGSATAFADASGNLIAAFPITGGTLDPDVSNALVEHAGSGLRLSTTAGAVDLENFLIDTTRPTTTLFGRVTVGSTVLPSVDLFTADDRGFLFLSAAAGGALEAFLGIPNLSGANVGFALTNPLPVPEPETYALMAVGLGMLVLARRRSGRKPSVVAA